MGKIISPKRKQGRVEYPTTLAKAVLVNEGKEGMTVQDFIDDEPRRLAEIYEPVFADTLPVPSAATMRKLYLLPADHAEGSDVKEEYITARELVDEEYVYRWEKLGRTAPAEIAVIELGTEMPEGEALDTLRRVFNDEYKFLVVYDIVLDASFPVYPYPGGGSVLFIGTENDGTMERRVTYTFDIDSTTTPIEITGYWREVYENPASRMTSLFMFPTLADFDEESLGRLSYITRGYDAVYAIYDNELDVNFLATLTFHEDSPYGWLICGTFTDGTTETTVEYYIATDSVTEEVSAYERVVTTRPVDRHVLISQSEYDQLVEDEEVDPELIYMVYEDEDENENENENENEGGPSEPSPNL